MPTHITLTVLTISVARWLLGLFLSKVVLAGVDLAGAILIGVILISKADLLATTRRLLVGTSLSHGSQVIKERQGFPGVLNVVAVVGVLVRRHGTKVSKKVF